MYIHFTYIYIAGFNLPTSFVHIKKFVFILLMREVKFKETRTLALSLTAGE